MPQISAITANQTATYVKGCCYHSSLVPWNGTAPNFRPMSVVAKRLDGARCHLVWRSRPRLLCVRRRPTHRKKRAQPPVFGLCVLWPNGCMNQDATCGGK